MLRWAPLLICAALLLAGVSTWLFVRPDVQVTMRLPSENAANTATGSGLRLPGDLGGKLTTGDGTPATDLPGEWPCFRGPQRDNVSRQPQSLARSWPDGGPKALWSVDLGEGYAGATVWSGRVFITDYNREHQADSIRSLSLADGKEIWRYEYPVPIKRQHGMSRTVPAITPKYLVSFGPKCHVVCLDPNSGKLLWSKDLVREFKSTVPPWYAGQCPLIEDDKVILAPAGEALMIAADCATGNVLWKTPNKRGWQMTHVSITPMVFNDRRMYVYCGSGGAAGVAADTGELLWDTDKWTVKIATIASPVPLNDGRLFFSGGYDAGSMMLKLKQDGDKYTAEVQWRLKQETFGATQQTPVLLDGYIYGIRPNGDLVCLDLDGKVRWASGVGKRFGLGPLMIAGGLIYACDDSGKVSLVEAKPDGFNLLAQAQVLHGHDAWAPLALAGSRLFVRDLTKMVCLEVGGN